MIIIIVVVVDVESIRGVVLWELILVSLEKINA